MRCAIDDLLLPSSGSGSGTACEMLAEYWQQIMFEKLYTHQCLDSCALSCECGHLRTAFVAAVCRQK